MEISITSRGEDVPENVRTHTEEKLRRLDRIEHRPTHVHVYFDSERAEKKAEIRVVVAGRGDNIANGHGDNYRAAFDQGLDKLLTQIKRDRERTRERTRERQTPKL